MVSLVATTSVIELPPKRIDFEKARNISAVQPWLKQENASSYILYFSSTKRTGVCEIELLGGRQEYSDTPAYSSVKPENKIEVSDV